MTETVSLPATLFGQDTGAPPLVMAHGLFGQARNFTTVARRLSAGRRVVTLDLRNHGTAPHADAMTYQAMAADLAQTLALAARPVVLLGHSMGGKAAMTLALTRPELIAGLIVADIAPVTYDHREHGSIIEAMQALDLSTVSRRSDADRALAGPIPDPGVRGFIVSNLAIEDGAARWRPNLAALTRHMPEILAFPTDLPHATYDGPTLFLYGATSHYVAEAHRPACSALFPNAGFEAIQAGHWIHAEAPDAFLGAVDRWVATLD
ncbi:MAG: alpha/beta fold hydrolase [Pseudomonadota bacterium]